MTVIERSALLAHPVEQVFDLVADIERYPEFLKGCVGADIAIVNRAGQQLEQNT